MTKFLLFTAILSLQCYAQAPAVQWQKTFGGSDSESARSVIPTSDGGYLVSAFSYSNNGDISNPLGLDDIWLFKIDDAGALEWDRSYGGSGFDASPKVFETADGGYILAGLTKSSDGDATGSHGNFDILIVKVASDGSKQWHKAFGGTGDDALNDIRQTPDGGYIVAGFAANATGDITFSHGGNDGWLIKLDPSGAIEWQKTYGGSSNDGIGSVLPVQGGYMLEGATSSGDGDVTVQHGAGDIWIIKIDNAGAIEWQKTYGGSLNDSGGGFCATADGGFIFSGSTFSNDGDITSAHGNVDGWIVKIDPAGTVQWQKALGGSGQDGFRDIIQTVDGGYLSVGFSDSNDGDVSGVHGSYDVWLLKISAQGIILWQKILGGTDGDIANGVVQAQDTGFLVACDSASADGDLTAVHGAGDVWLVRLAADTLSSPEFDEPALTVYPNPVSSLLTISVPPFKALQKITVRDMTGKKIIEQAGGSRLLNVANLANGIYLLEMDTVGGKQVLKFIKE